MNHGNSWQGKTALITGASSGIGAAVARKLAAEGLTVWITARRADRLQSLADEIRQAGGTVHIRACDLAQPAAREALLAEIGCPDVLVNNAGLGWYGYAAEMEWQTAQEILEVNIVALAQLTLAMLPAMKRRGSGRIINIGSIAGGFPNQGIAIYSASKAFVDAFTTSIYRELKGSGVRISVLRLGPVITEFFTSAEKRPGAYSLPMDRFSITAEQAAKSVWRLLLRPRRVLYLPRILAVTRWIELLFGWLIDLLGPLLLRGTKRAM